MFEANRAASFAIRLKDTPNLGCGGDDELDRSSREDGIVHPRGAHPKDELDWIGLDPLAKGWSGYPEGAFAYNARGQGGLTALSSAAPLLPSNTLAGSCTDPVL
jgi:hypothetical protein